MAALKGQGMRGWLFGCLLLTAPLFSSPGQILLLAKQGKHSQAIKSYQSTTQTHDYELLQALGLTLLKEGCHQNDPEIQLLSLFGAAISAHEEAYPLLEEGLKNKYPQIQLIALQAIANSHFDQAEQGLIKAMGSEYLLIRLEAAKQLALKNHPEAVSQAESLLYKMPSELLPYYASLISHLDSPKAIPLLRKLLHHPTLKIRLAVMQNIVNFRRDDFLPQLRHCALHSHYAQQEACAYAFGLFHDEPSRQILEKLSRSPCPAVSLAAYLALYRLGDEKAHKKIEEQAATGDIYAISLLGDTNEDSPLLYALAKQKNPSIRFNADLALLNQGNAPPLSELSEVVFKKNLYFASKSSPGKTMRAWKIAPKEDAEDFKEKLLERLRNVSSKHFIELSHSILNSHEKELVPVVTFLLEEIGSQEAIDCLQAHQQQLGAPLVRHYCNLALYRLNEPGPYKEQLMQWVKQQNQTPLLRLEKTKEGEIDLSHHTLTPDQSSALLIKAYESFAMHLDQGGMDALLEAIASGHPKNKYVLAGLLMRATH